MTKLKHALRLAKKGFYIFPVAVGAKKPVAGVSWKGVRTKDPETIRKWFAENPKINYGVSPGDNCVVIDLDIKDGIDGVQAFCDLEKDNGHTETFAVSTPGGGTHLYFKCDGVLTNSDRHWPKGVDIRGSSGYVVGPGCSLFDGRVYAVTKGGRVADLPEWAMRRMKHKGEGSQIDPEDLEDLDSEENINKAKYLLQVRPPAVFGDGGDTHTYVTFCKLRECGVSFDTAMELIMEEGGWHDRSDPPQGYDYMEQKAINAFKYAAKDAGGEAPVEIDMSDLYEGGEIPPENNPEFSFSATTADTIRSGFVNSGNFGSITVKRETVISDFLPAHGFTALLAKRGVGKTITALDMALSVACGIDWQGVSTKKDYAVAYLCGEDFVGLQENYEAWCIKKDIKPDPDRFIMADGLPQLMNEDDTVMWLAALIKEFGKGRKVLVVLDTWQRSTTGGSQSDDEAMQKAVINIERLAHYLNGPVVAAFHPPKHDETMVAGSAVIENSTSAIWTVTRDGGTRHIEVTRIKGRGEGGFVNVDFEQVSLGRKDDHGRDVVGIVPVATKTFSSSPDCDKDTLSAVVSKTRDQEWQSVLADMLPNWKGTPTPKKIVKAVIKRGVNAPILKGMDEVRDLLFKGYDRKAAVDDLTRAIEAGNVDVSGKVLSLCEKGSIKMG